MGEIAAWKKAIYGLKIRESRGTGKGYCLLKALIYTRDTETGKGGSPRDDCWLHTWLYVCAGN